MASRLDRLVTLLETGSTQLIRNTAAQQLADIQKQHPEELFNLLTRVIPYLRSKSWDTRTAAAKAIGGIVDNAEKFDPNAEDDPIKSETNGHSNGSVKKEEEVELPPLSDDQLQLETLDIPMILKNGKHLLGSAGREYDFKLAAMDPAERLAYQKKSLKARLGIGGDYMDEDLVTQEDIVAPANSRSSMPPPTPGLHRLDTSVSRQNSISSPSHNTAVSPSHDQPLQTPVDENGHALSKRQLNALKRKNKMHLKGQANKVRVIDLATRRPSQDYPQTPAEPHAVKSEVKAEEESTENKVNDYFSLERHGDDDDSKVVQEFKGAPAAEKSTIQTEEEEQGLEWPYDRLCEILTVDLFDPNWEIRHGAAMGLREVIRVHGAGAGRQRGKSRAQNDLQNQRWLDDMSCRICCVFMLDRFGDYVSDNVVAPIRETAGQTLGAVLQYLSSDLVRAVYTVLYRLVMQDEFNEKRVWQACHGGMIGMRYLVAVRNDLLLTDPSLMDGVLSAVMRGLGDFDDDVRAVSAATLIPVAKEFVNLRPAALNQLIGIVWDCLSNLSDDLSASTGSVMDLLAKLCSFNEVLDAMKLNAAKDPEQSFTHLVPRLFPFLRHTITSVRSAVLRALLTFLDIEGEGTTGWINGKALRLIYQNLLVERNEPVLKLSLQVWSKLLEVLATQGPEAFANEFQPHIDPLVTLTVHPIGVSRHPIPMDPTLFIRPSGQSYAPNGHVTRRISPVSEGQPKKRRRLEKHKEKETPPPSAHNIDAPMMEGDVDLVGADTIIRSKIYASQALGKAIALWPKSSRQGVFAPRLLPHLRSPYSTSQLTTCMISEEFARASDADKDDLSQDLVKTLRSMVEDERPVCYGDLTSYLTIVRAQCQSLLNTFRDLGHIAPAKLPTLAVIVQGEPDASQYAFSITDGEKIVGPDFERLKKALTPASRVAATQPLLAAQQDVQHAIDEAKAVKQERDIRIKAASAAAIVAFREIPKKPALTIKGMMDSVKNEENQELQKRSAAAVAILVEHVAASGKRVVVEKVVGNLVKFCCMETAETPEFHVNADVEIGILSLKKEEDIRDHPDAAKFEREAKAARVTRRGAKEALEQMVSNFGGQIFEKIPILRTLIEEPIKQAFTGDELPSDIRDPDNVLGQEVVDGLSTLRALVSKFHPDLHAFVLDLLPLIAKALQSKLSVLRYAAAKCFATICSVMTVQGITMLVEKVMPAISNPVDVHCRQGAIECIYHLIHVMEDGILPYVIFLIVPVLGRMSDSDNDVRLIATTTFATLVKLVPLEAGIPDPPGLSEELLKGRDRERKFIAQMLDAKKVEPFEIPVAIKAELRSYQQDGVNWLAFLNRYHLHGILCDDMGLGKTLQTICIVASDHHNRAEEYKKTGSPDVRRLPSLIVCPPTLSGHWQQEIRTYAPFLNPVAYVGPPAERAKVRAQLADADIVITSYDICRNDIEVMAPLNWNYCVLDEGHLIKNSKTKTTYAVKRLVSNHRLILTGTPIQNNVLELWSLFDFLMPGFLGSEKVFQDRFAKPIAASRFSKSSSKEQEAGALAIEALHKQVLPFLLRRLKEEVLDDLPPKILQNYYCDLSDLQRRLFEDFTKKEGKTLAEKATSNDKESKQHIFQALQYMRKLCNSPALVMKPEHKQYQDIQHYLSKSGSSLSDPAHAPKLNALRDLLLDCGIGTTPSEGAGHGDVPNAAEAVSPHRALIFCQMKEMLDMVQDTVLKKMLPSVQYMRLDGGVEASRRQEIVNKFNSDPSYDVLLLTTSVGGLGLNLTGADTVIFVEHDWNPQKDMQAMDRAHRIGQKKVVNVYRIVTRGTLEEKILSLQRFKIDVASTVVNQQNAGLGTMETDQILDLFNLSTDSADLSNPNANNDTINEEDAVDATGEVREKGKKGFLDELGELWDERQYQEEFDLDNFLATMKG
ncbi:SNF2 family DNA-dependent ATPase domain-containing protein [Macrophomina phaseolina]|uniref:SNF2 family DNA-dependent ATPase domain-containing protein n=1 Tax=Macrophomina phaseolina TaxID=35725 RepID=A0ABQ8G820_9PEZI|nr:SNF2 family DNA-dependent ATPase domain-containing protein [Macrophomina phaseolina]